MSAAGGAAHLMWSLPRTSLTRSGPETGCLPAPSCGPSFQSKVLSGAGGVPVAHSCQKWQSTLLRLLSAGISRSIRQQQAFATCLNCAACRPHQAEPNGQEKPTSLPKGVWPPTQVGLQCVVLPGGDQDFRWQDGILQEGKWEWPVHLPSRGVGPCDATALACPMAGIEIGCCARGCTRMLPSN